MPGLTANMDKLTLQNVDAGIQAILANVDSLTEEAALLFQNERMARAYTLAHLSREESAKVTMLHSVGAKLLLGIEIDWKSFWKRFRDHKFKLFQDSFFNVALAEINEGEEKPHYSQIAGAVPDRNSWKNESLYVSWKNGFQNPIKVIDKEKARNILLLARRSYELNKWISEKMRKFANRNAEEILHLKPIIEEALNSSAEEMSELVNKLGEKLASS
jgi:AbiV family abortive infection protein